MTEFAIGQRWLSENETELGLGIIERLDHRLVTVYFPATEEQRTYAVDNAPLSRIAYEEGDQIETLHGDQLTVERVEPHNGTLVYMVKADPSSEQLVPVPETQLNHFLDLDRATDRLFSGQIDSLKWFELRYSAMKAREKQQSSQIIGLQGPRVDLIGHQLHIASEVGNRFAPRVLLSDEVGLGKTIEAGMIIHQQLISQRAQRVLILVPQTLIHQWFVEMIRRFNLHFSIFDQSRIDSLVDIDQDELAELGLEDAIDLDSIQLENPYLSEQLVLCSTEFMAQCDINQMATGEWDLLVVDEAHHLEWHPEQPSKEYLRVESIAQNTPGLLLLSATPEQLGQDGHFARLRLLDPNRFYDLNKFVEEQNQYAPIADLVSELELNETWSTDLKKKAAQYITDCEIVENNKPTILRELLDRNGTGRVVYRNTRKNIKGFPNRVLMPYALSSAPEYQALQLDLPDDLELAVQQLIHPETQLEDASWCEFDPRVVWLKDFLKSHRNEKIVIICANKDTAINLDLYCRFKLGINCCTFHEDLDLISRDRAAAHFADSEDGAQAMFCSEIGSEGRNFQFSHHLVLMDLPLNPDLLEQRIGRLDRIGQAQDIQIHVPYMQDTAQHILFDWYHTGMHAFEKTNAAGGKIFVQTKSKLLESLRHANNQEFREQLLDETAKLAIDINHDLAHGKDKLLELSSFNPENAQRLIELVEEMDEKSPQNFMQQTWNRFGVDFEDHSEKAYVIRPGNHMYVGAFPGLSDDGLTATFDRKTALSRDDMHYLTWEHPMITGAIDLILGENKGNASVCILKNKAIKAGTILVESLYKLECTAPKYLQAQRFLPYRCFRFLTDINGSDLAPKVGHRNISNQCSKLDKRNARLVLKSEEKDLKSILEKTDKLAHKQADQFLSNIVESMQHQQTEELNRLTSLQKKNPNIREDELVFLKKQTELLAKYLGDAQLQLEAVRVIVAI
ncbi:MAG: RNA polymerase-associated protein RapA [Kangiellaceae bacterium]|nr:RNA polymerase-associated protein RapA [Kangiellaceae bacterium]